MPVEGIDINACTVFYERTYILTYILWNHNIAYCRLWYLIFCKEVGGIYLRV